MEFFFKALLIIQLLFHIGYAQVQSPQLIAGTGSAGFVDGKLAQLNKPMRLAPYKNNSIVFADINEHAIRIASFDDEIITLAGGPDKKGYQDGLAEKAKFNSPHGVVYDKIRDIIYVAEAGSNLIRKVKPNSSVTTLVLKDTLKTPHGIAVEKK